MLAQKELDTAERRRLKAEKLALAGGMGEAVRSTLRAVQPLRYAWETYKCKKIQRVWRGYHARKRFRVGVCLLGCLLAS